ncbi:uncharacterized protein LOC121991285 [Zingiber officinale]|uniref:uncharacterized protein LOC121991285 n=1 Tax=Zingiber officinale TaxID=94328 RepID=UPI001C4C8AD0|nr:uncharacterized protein LOC121991285 [Zingiber officinale]
MSNIPLVHFRHQLIINVASVVGNRAPPLSAAAIDHFRALQTTDPPPLPANDTPPADRRIRVMSVVAAADRNSYLPPPPGIVVTVAGHHHRPPPPTTTVDQRLRSLPPSAAGNHL